MALITEQHSFQQSIGCCNTNFTTGIQSKQFQLRRNHICCHFCISCCSSTATAKNKTTNNLKPICEHIECSEITYYMFLAKKWIFSQFLSATIGPSVARVSAPRTTPSLKMMPTIVVPVFIDFGSLKPFLINISLLNNK